MHIYIFRYRDMTFHAVKMSKCLVFVLLPIIIESHEYNVGKCPQYTPMQGFDWDKVK